MMYLRDSTGQRYPLDDIEGDSGLVGERVKQLLDAGHPFIDIGSVVLADNVYTRWTVLTRNEDGLPLLVSCEEFDGEVSVIDHSEDYG